jgi:hypothetical protein
MKIIVSLFVTLLLFTSSATADTIDFWHVFYNKIKLKEYNDYSLKSSGMVIQLKALGIKPGDSITVRYFRDTPCHDCTTSVLVEDNAHTAVTRATATGTYQPLTFSAVKLLAFAQMTGQTSFTVYYSEKSIWLNIERKMLCTIRLE